MTVGLPITVHPALTQNPIYKIQYKSVRANVLVLALSTSIRQVHGEDEDVYLAEVSVKGQNVELAKLVDSYHGKPIRRAVLEERSRFSMRLKRVPACDVIASSIFLGSEFDIFDPSFRETVGKSGSAKISCFKVDHDATRLEK